MIEKVNKYHPDKIADRIAGAIVDLAYAKQENPKVAVEVLLGHGECTVIIESSVVFNENEISNIVYRITENQIKIVHINYNGQDEHLAENQSKEIRCGDNGIFKGVPLTEEEKDLSKVAKELSDTFQEDGKYILANRHLIVCQSNASNKVIYDKVKKYKFVDEITINPIGTWTGGLDVDSGATNRKLGSDMAQSVTGGGLHGKDLSKADVSVNIYAFLKAQKIKKPVELYCAIGDKTIDGKPYAEIVEIARKFIKKVGGFEKFAEWGLF